MHVVIVGCGRVGSSLAGQLCDDGHTVSIIDRKKASFSRLPDSFTGQRFVGVGFDRDLLIEAGIERADAVAAVTNGDNSNILIARVARESFGIERVVARIYDPNRAHLYQRLGIPTVAPAVWTTERVLRRLLPGNSRLEWTDQSGQISLVEHMLSDAWEGRPAADVDRTGVRLVSCCRRGLASLPGPDERLVTGDVITVAVPAAMVEQVERLLAAPSTDTARSSS